MSIPHIVRKSQKSVKLSVEEIKTLEKLRNAANSDTALSESFNIDRVSLIRIISFGSGSENNVKKIRKILLQTTN